jgi:hypothetical protein
MLLHRQEPDILLLLKVYRCCKRFFSSGKE